MRQPRRPHCKVAHFVVLVLRETYMLLAVLIVVWILSVCSRQSALMRSGRLTWPICPYLVAVTLVFSGTFSLITVRPHHSRKYMVPVTGVRDTPRLFAPNHFTPDRRASSLSVHPLHNTTRLVLRLYHHNNFLLNWTCNDLDYDQLRGRLIQQICLLETLSALSSLS